MTSAESLKVSIITIIYNADKTLDCTIRSVIGQTYKNIEYIIVDGGSTDKSVNIIKGYDQFIAKWISEPDKGISDAFNKGIALSTGDLIGIINADDWYEKDAIEKMVLNFKNDMTILSGSVRLFQNNSKSKIKKSTLTNIEKEMQIWHPGTFVPKNVYNVVGGYDINYKVLMDYDFVARCLKQSVQFCFFDYVIANMRAGGTSHKLIAKSMKESLDIKNKHFGRRFLNTIEYLYFLVYYSLLINMKNIIYRANEKH